MLPWGRSRIWIPDLGKTAPEPGPRSTTTNLSIFNTNNCSKLWKYNPNFSIPDPRVNKAPDPDPQHCFSKLKIFLVHRNLGQYPD
jgi:hypothetical protein